MGKKVAVIGSGIVGQTLANGFLSHGYDVAVGTNSPGKYQELKSKTSGKAKVGTFEETAKFGEIVVLAVKGTAAEAAMKTSGIANLAGKVVIDTTSDRRGTSRQRRPPVLHVAERFAHGEASEARP